mgnify:CR=1 FL=1
MSNCNFSIPFEGTPDKLLVKARFAVESQGGNFNGDNNAGNFNLSVFGNTIAGSYTVEGQTINITITEKPFIIPCSTIEDMLKKQMTS